MNVTTSGAGNNYHQIVDGDMIILQPTLNQPEKPTIENTEENNTMEQSVD